MLCSIPRPENLVSGDQWPGPGCRAGWDLADAGWWRHVRSAWPAATIRWKLICGHGAGGPETRGSVVTQDSVDQHCPSSGPQHSIRDAAGDWPGSPPGGGPDNLTGWVTSPSNVTRVTNVSHVRVLGRGKVVLQNASYCKPLCLFYWHSFTCDAAICQMSSSTFISISCPVSSLGKQGNYLTTLTRHLSSLWSRLRLIQTCPVTLETWIWKSHQCQVIWAYLTHYLF